MVLSTVGDLKGTDDVTCSLFRLSASIHYSAPTLGQAASGSEDTALSENPHSPLPLSVCRPLTP